MKINPALSLSQMALFGQLRELQHREDVTARSTKRQSRGQAKLHQPAIDPHFVVGAQVEFTRDIPGTKYRAGQQGTILSLHNQPSKTSSSIKPLKVMAEVRVNHRDDDDLVNIDNLKAIG